MKISRNYIFLLVLILGILPVSYTYFNASNNHYKNIRSFDDCVKAGIPVTPTYPETCKIPGKLFTNQNQKNFVSKKDTPTLLIATSTDSDPKNYTYYIDGQSVKLIDGVGVLPANKATNRPTTTVGILSNTAPFDVNGDTLLDKLFLLASKVDGEKKHAYYLASLLSLHTGYTGSNAVYLGIDIASTTIGFKNNELQITYNIKEEGLIVVKKRSFVFRNELIEEVLH